jgi:hypothetical protein
VNGAWVDAIEILVGLATVAIGVGAWRLATPWARIAGIALVAAGIVAVVHGTGRWVGA